jgi:uncharacterized protein YbcI
MTLPDERRPQQARGELLMEISSAMMSLFKSQFGRGPTRARAEWCGNDAITVIMEETLTPAERKLVAMGEHQRLRETRLYFQYASMREICEPIEAITGRKLKAFVSGTDSLVDGLSVETFVLHPEGYDGPSRIDLL